MDTPEDRTIGELLENCWGLQLACSTCNKRVKWLSGELERYPRALPVYELAKRTRCGDCGSRDGWVPVVNDPGARQRKDLEAFERKPNPMMYQGRT